MNSRRRAFAAASLSVAALLVALSGCEGYSYTFNERTVFEKPKLFRDYTIADERLAACVAQAISDGDVRSADALRDLNCSQAGITSLAGIEVFTELRRLGLDGNRITDLAPLQQLRKLELVQLRNNGLRALPAALCGGTPRSFALAGNPELVCSDVATLQACGARFSDLPEHCAGK